MWQRLWLLHLICRAKREGPDNGTRHCRSAQPKRKPVNDLYGPVWYASNGQADISCLPIFRKANSLPMGV